MPAGRVQEMSEVKSDEPDQRALRSQLQEAIRIGLVGEVTRGMAHEINQPLTSIKLGVEMLLLQPRDNLPDGIRSELESIADSVQRVAETTARMRTMAMPPNRAQQLIEPARICSQLQSLLAGQLQGLGIELICDAPDPGPRVAGDEVELQQALLYLLENAVEAVQRTATPAAEVHLHLSRTGKRLRFNVSDNGPGVPAPDRDRLFTPFFTSKPVALTAGLGLNIARRIAERQHGRIRLRRSRLGGACFALELPIADTSAS